MNYQEFCANQIKSILDLNLKKAQFDNKCYKYAIKQGLGLYAETYYFNSTCKEDKFFDMDFSKKYQGQEIWRNILGSENAYKLCSEIEKGSLPYGSKKGRSVPFYEHITPKAKTYNDLIQLNGKNPKLCDIKKILNCSKLVILTYEEKDILDSKKDGKNIFTEKDIETINYWLTNGIIDKLIATDAIKSMKPNGKFLTTGENGTAYARLAHLASNGVNFCLGNASGSNLIRIYMNNNSHIISTHNK